MPFWRRSADRIHSLERKLAALADQLDAVKSRYDVSDALVAEFETTRLSEEYRSVFDRKNPLVSVCVATYHRPTELIDRCLRSLLEQTYQHLEIIVIGDCCTDDTSERMAAEVKDPRVRYENLPARTPYPLDSELRWMVAGTPAMNRALELAQGDFVTHLDHDDEYDRKRLERLVPFIQETRADLVFHPFYYQRQRGDWKLREARTFGPAQVTTSSVLYHRWLTRVQWDLHSFRFREAGDWGRFRRISHLGAKIARNPEPLLKHYMQKQARRS